MKSSIIIGCLLLLAATVGTTQPAHSQPTKTWHGNNVGDIRPDSLLDDAAFTLCHEARVTQYYSVETVYRGGAKAMRTEIFAQLKPVPLASGQHGWVTVRFVINCRGETGRFRIQQMDRDYQPCTFHPVLVGQLLAAAQSLRHWQPGAYQGVVYDSYYYLTFKIADGSVQDVLP